ncbi:hypothetical protein LCGC14_1032280 [marine sediment metagenome]|uniref:Uncharacterized protein n=1 Tax=marine sediment metagenome TaxID=412755 RepID=A0A0F9NFY6_9ZZZZ
MPIYEKLLTDKEIRKITPLKLKKILGNPHTSSVSKLELYLRVQKIRPKILKSI